MMRYADRMGRSVFFDFLEKSLFLSALFIGLLYICGLFITNVHLRRFGIFDLPPFRLEYILVGFTFLFIVLSPILVILVFSAIIGRQVSLLSKIIESIVVLVCVSITAVYLALSFLYGDFKWGWILPEFRKIIKIVNFYWLLLAWLIYATGKSLITDLKRARKEEIFNLRELWIPVIFFFGIFIIAISFYAQKIYPKIHPAFAGGKLLPAEILVTKEGAQILISLGVVTSEDRRVKNILIIHETPSTIYITPPKTSRGERIDSIALPKSTVASIAVVAETH